MAVGGGDWMKAVDLAAMQGIVLWGQRQGVTLLEKDTSSCVGQKRSQKIKHCDLHPSR